jgi:hypothetical protein
MVLLASIVITIVSGAIAACALANLLSSVSWFGPAAAKLTMLRNFAEAGMSCCAIERARVVLPSQDDRRLQHWITGHLCQAYLGRSHFLQKFAHQFQPSNMRCDGMLRKRMV